jgi:hypothetical protein
MNRERMARAAERYTSSAVSVRVVLKGGHGVGFEQRGYERDTDHHVHRRLEVE